MTRSSGPGLVSGSPRSGCLLKRGVVDQEVACTAAGVGLRADKVQRHGVAGKLWDVECLLHPFLAGVKVRIGRERVCGCAGQHLHPECVASLLAALEGVDVEPETDCGV